MRKILLFSVALGFSMPMNSYAFHSKSGVLSSPMVANLVLNQAPYSALQSTVSGRVTHAGKALAGVSVTVVGKNLSVQTDQNGEYTIQASLGSTLRFTMVGLETKDLSVTANRLSVDLSTSESSLEEVVVVGYGSQKKSHLTGAVSSVNVEKVFGNRPIADLGRGLQGAVPGLSVVVPSGEVGSDPIMKIRGQVGSIQGNSTPLILVDNVEIPSIQYVNPNDIESITVLKDAASSSIYGAKAAFGVILITTKKGASTDSQKFTYSNNFVMQSPFKDIDIAGIDGLQYTVDAHNNMKQVGPAGGFWRVDQASLDKVKEWQQLYGSTVKNSDPILYGRDWMWDGSQKFGYRLYDPVDAMIRNNAFSQIHNLGLNGKSGNTNYSLNIGYLGQQGMMKPAQHDDYRRLTPTLNLTTKVNSILTLRGGAMYAEGTKRYPNSMNADGFGADPWLYLYRWSRLFPIGVQEQGQDIIDPAFSAKKSNDAVKTDKYLNLNFGTTINFSKNWDLKADYAYSTQNNTNFSSVPYVQGRTTWYGVEALKDAAGNQVYVDEQGNPTDDGGVLAYRFPLADHTVKSATNVYKYNMLSKRHTFNAFTNYNLDLGDHAFKFMAGTNVVAYDLETTYSQRTNLINNDNPQFNFATGTETAGGGKSWDSQVGFFSRANYTFKDKYLLEANIRYDASSVLPANLRWKWYPSVSGGWVISNEEFMKDIASTVSFAKLRGSWGSIGDQSMPNDLYIPTMSIGKNSWLSSNGDQYFQLGTPKAISANISWQDIEHLNVGADLRFFNNKLGVTAEWFQRKTKNMLIAGDFLPDTYGSSAPLVNEGHLRTRGWELALDYAHQFDNGLRLTFNANVADAVTFVTKGADFRTPWADRSLGTSFSTGRRYGDVYGFVTDRLFQKDDFVYDANGNFTQTDIIFNGTSKRTNVLAGDNPVYQTYFEDGNQTLLISPGDVKFVDVNGDGYIDAGTSTNGDAGDRVVIGNTTPRYEFGFRFGAEFKGFDLSVFLQGVGKRSIWGDGQLAIPGYFSKEGAMPQAIAGDYWREDRTNAFYPRAWNSNGSNSNYVMRPQSKYMLDMSYLKIKNITVGYGLPKRLLDRAKLSNVRIYVSLENYFTFDKLRGLPIDPEAISGTSPLRAGSSYNLGRTGASNPTFKSASMGLQIGF